MKLLVSLLALTNRAQDAVDNPVEEAVEAVDYENAANYDYGAYGDYGEQQQQLAGPGAVGVANLLEVADDAGDYVDYFDEDDSRARPTGSNGKPTGWKPSWSNSNKNKRNGLDHIQSGADYEAISYLLVDLLLNNFTSCKSQ